MAPRRARRLRLAGTLAGDAPRAPHRKPHVPARKHSKASGREPPRFVSTVPRSPATQARRELGLRLRQIRKTAGLTGQMLADATGQHFTRISRIENGAQPPTERNIQDWCAACGAEDQIPDLIATARSVESAYLEWTRQSRAGMRRIGAGRLPSVPAYPGTTPLRR